MIITNANIVCPTKIVKGSLLIEDGKIMEIGDIAMQKDDEVIDAENGYLLPGGIDAHVHFNLKTPNGKTADDFESGTRAALAGGTTTVIDFITPNKNQNLQVAFEQRMAEAENSFTDFSFHQSITYWDDTMEQQMEDAVKNQGITSFKTYLTYSSSIGINLDILEKVMRKAAELDAIVLVHAELAEINNRLAKEFANSELTATMIHQMTHPAISEEEAIDKVIELSKLTSCKTYIVHVSTSKGIQSIQKAKTEGVPVFAETCPQYFLFHDKIYQKENPCNTEFIFSPPLRFIDDKRHLFQSVAKGEFDCISTDHCSFKLKQKNAKKKNYRKIPHGVGGVQYRLLNTQSEFVYTGMISWTHFAQITAENAAKLFGLKNKGKILVGYDADLVLYQLASKSYLFNDLKDYSKSDINIYSNRRTHMKIGRVIKGGTIVFDNNQLNESIPQGLFIKK